MDDKPLLKSHEPILAYFYTDFCKSDDSINYTDTVIATSTFTVISVISHMIFKGQITFILQVNIYKTGFA